MKKLIGIGLMLLLGVFAASLQANERVALVIGNARYQSAPLANPLNDAQAVSAKLKTMGFSVVYGENLDRAGLIRKVQEFRQALRPDGVALVFYSGHGVEVNGVNYLLPVDNAGIRSVEDVEVYGVAAQNLVSQMEAAQSQLNLVILDACRDNPLPSQARSVSKGLSQMRAQRGTLIAFATSQGATADDGRGRHSPYTEALLRWLGEPGLEVQQVLNRVGLDVSAQTNGIQTPWVSSSPVPPILLAGSAVVIQRPTGPDSVASANEGEVSITVTPRTAEVYVDGALVGSGDRRVTLPAGKTVTISAQASGYEAFQQKVLVQRGQVANARLTLNPVASSVSPPLPLANPSTVTSRRFAQLVDGVLDAKEGIVWAARDNGSDIDWPNSVQYCRTLGTHWSLPTAAQLKGLYDESGQFAKTTLGDDAFTIQPATPWIELTGGIFWSSERDSSSFAKAVYLSGGELFWNAMSYDLHRRALCVRPP